MSCESKFDGEVSVSCLLELVADVRKGASLKVLMQALWLLGCLIAKFATPQSGIGFSAMSEDLDVESLDCESGCGDLESVLCAIETKCAERETSIQSSGPAVGTQGWEVFIPLILELVKMIIENRRKKQQPVPTP
jgi:hypothetical protein